MQDFSELELAQHARRAAWRPIDRRDGGPLPGGAPSDIVDWGAQHDHGSTLWAGGRRLFGGGMHFYTNLTPRARSFLPVRQSRRCSCRLQQEDIHHISRQGPLPHGSSLTQGQQANTNNTTVNIERQRPVRKNGN